VVSRFREDSDRRPDYALAARFAGQDGSETGDGAMTFTLHLER
jgi:hypothetical protein